MANYSDSRDQLVQVLIQMTPDSPDFIKTRAAITALDDAETAEAERDFVAASRRLDDAVAKVEALVQGLRPNPATELFDGVTKALAAIQPAVEEVAALAAGEPASALPAMQLSNQPTFPTPNATVFPPLREVARSTATAAISPGLRPSVEDMIDAILVREGGFVNNSSDRGGPTNFGITQRTLAAARGRPVLVEEVRAMKVDEARAIYRSNYFTAPRIDELPALLQPVMFDMSINHGPGTAIKLLQLVLTSVGCSCTVDGGIGDETIERTVKAVSEEGENLINLLVDKREDFYRQIVAGDASQGVFLKGWLNRAKEFRVA